MNIQKILGQKILGQKILGMMSVACFASALSAGPVLYDRSIPVTNLNNDAGADRSNVAWNQAATQGAYNWTYGDDFTIGSAGQSFQITDLTVWIVGDADHDPLNSIFSNLTLLGGIPGTVGNQSPACSNLTGSVCLDANGISDIATVSTANAAPNVSISSVTYDGSQTYQANGGAFRDLYQVTFQNLAWNIQGGTAYSFFVTGVPGTVGNSGNSPSLSASNAALGGSSADGADGLLWEVAQDSGTNAYVAMDQWNSNGTGWDKSSDINVLISATDTDTPEPGTLGIFAAGLALLGIARRRKAL